MVVRIHRQPPINPVWILVAIGLGASGLFLPLFEAVKAIIIVAAVVVLIIGLLSRLFMRIPPGTVGLTARANRFDSVRKPGVHRVNPVLALTHVDHDPRARVRRARWRRSARRTASTSTSTSS